MATRSLTPRQARSRESQRKLMQAAIKVLATYGVEGATIPRIALEAGLTPGAVYRRFADKNALLETVVLEILKNQAESLRTWASPAKSEKALPELVEEIIAAMIKAHRAHPGLLRALRRFLQASDHLAFKRKGAELEKRFVQGLVERLLAFREQIRHPDPQHALSFALVMLSSTVNELFLEDDGPAAWSPLVPVDDAALVRELKGMFLRYVGCGDASHEAPSAD
jgi:AcrR family transcriptional regulator